MDEHARGAPAVPRDRSPRHRLAEAVIRYLDAHYDQDVTLEEVAQALYVSKYHLSRAFKEVTGCTLVEYLTAVRLQHARYLLASTRLHVADIASRTGFNSLSHFNRVFLRQVGMPPCSTARRFPATVRNAPPEQSRDYSCRRASTGTIRAARSAGATPKISPSTVAPARVGSTVSRLMPPASRSIRQRRAP